MTPDDDDAELLRQYVGTCSEAAFAECVRRHLGPVYAVALRQVGGDAHLAEDVAQMVFTALARKAAMLTGRATIGGWLYRATHNAARDVVRTERRRRAREHAAHSMEDPSTRPGVNPEWEKLRPQLDEMMAELGEADRDAVWLRFFEGRPFAEIGAKLRLTENAARMRVERALEKLGAALSRRGVKSTTAALAIVLGEQGVAATPAGLPALVVHAAMTASAAGGLTFATAGAFFIMSKIKVAVIAAVALAGGATAVREVQASRRLNDEIAILRRTVQSSAAAREENGRLAATIAEAAGRNAEAGELVRLRQRMALLKARPEGVVDAEMKPLASFRNVGWDMPAAAFETQLWARTNGEMKEFAKIFSFTADGKAKLDAFFARLPESVRTRHGTPEQLLAPMAATWGREGAPVSVQIYGQTDHGTKVLVRAWARFSSGREAKLDMLFQRDEDGWRVPHPDEMVQGIINSLDPATGARIPKAK